MTSRRIPVLGLALAAVTGGCAAGAPPDQDEWSGNPILPGWTADPEVAVLDGSYWIFPTHSAPYEEQVFLDAYSSHDLVTWTRHPRVLDTSIVTWARKALWAPCVVERDGSFYLFFSANDLQRPGGPLWEESDPSSHTGGIGVAVAPSPAGPYRDLLGRPLIGEFHHGAQPIDQFVFEDVDGTTYLFYGGWGHCNVGVLRDDLTGFVPFDDGQTFHEVTPQGYVEGPVLFRRGGSYYFLWSEGGWGDASYRVAYALADCPTGPFRRVGTILERDESVATGAGHNSVLRLPGTDEWYVVYHRRPVPNQGRDHRVTCIDQLHFRADGTLEPVVMTFRGVRRRPL